MGALAAFARWNGKRQRERALQAVPLFETTPIRVEIVIGNLEQYSLSAISALAERAVAALVPR